MPARRLAIKHIESRGLKHRIKVSLRHVNINLMALSDDKDRNKELKRCVTIRCWVNIYASAA